MACRRQRHTPPQQQQQPCLPGTSITSPARALTCPAPPRAVDAKTEAQLKQCFSNYCRLAVGASKLMMDGDLKVVKDQWMQLCCDIGVAAPVGG